MLHQSAAKRYLHIAVSILIIIPVIIYLRYVYVYALNLPRQDDYDAILGFLNSYAATPTFSGKMSLLTAQHNEHRIFTSRLVYALYYKLTGVINFRHIIFINSFILISLFCVVAALIKKALPGLWHFPVLGLSLCLFALNNFENMNFAMAGMQNYGIILLMAGSLYLYSLPRRVYIAPAAILQALCIFSSGNGGLGAGFVFLFCLLAHNKLRGSISLAVLLVFAPLYYYGYHHPPTDFFTLAPGKFMPFFFHVAGGYFSYYHGVGAGVLLIILLFISLPIGRRLKIERPYLPILILAGFIFASAVIMSVFRGNMPIISSYSSRYLIYPGLLTALTFVLVLIKNQNVTMARFAGPAIVLVLLVCYRWNSLEGRDGFKAFRTQLQTMEYHYPDPVRAKQITDEACARGIYCIEKNRSSN